jgi:MFS family permease
VLAGGGALAAQRRSAPPPHEPTRADGGGRFWTPGFAALLGVPGALGVFFGALQLSVTAAAGPRGGFLYGALTLASLVGGIAWTRLARRIHRPPETVLRGLTVYFGLSGGLLAFSPWLVASLCAAGVALAPIMAMSTVRAEELVPAAVRTRAFAWMGATSAAGVAVGAAAAGALVGAHGPRAGVVLAGACAAVTALSGGSPGRSSPAASGR